MALAKQKKKIEENRREYFQASLGKALLVAVFLTIGFLNISNGPEYLAQASPQAGNWDGWIKLSSPADNWGMKLDTNRTFVGFSYGGSAEDGGASPSDPKTHVIGWISWNCADIGTCSGLDVEYKVELPGAPIVDLTGPGTIEYGDTATLNWSLLGAESCDGTSADNADWDTQVFGFADGAHTWTSPTGLTTNPILFTLTCSNTVGPTTDSVTVNVRAFTLALTPATVLTFTRSTSLISDSDTSHSIAITPWGSFGNGGEMITFTCTGLPSGAECYFNGNRDTLTISSFGTPVALQVRKISRLISSDVNFTVWGTSDTGIAVPMTVTLRPTGSTFRPPRIKEVD